jgi:hypothetical protein
MRGGEALKEDRVFSSLFELQFCIKEVIVLRLVIEILLYNLLMILARDMRAQKI